MIWIVAVHIIIFLLGIIKKFHGDWNDKTGKLFQYYKRLLTDLPQARSVRILKYSKNNSRGKYHMPTLNGNYNLTGNSNSETGKTGINSIPLYSSLTNSLQTEALKRVYVSTDPQTYSIVL